MSFDPMILNKARDWMPECRPKVNRLQMEAEGGCGVVGLAASIGLPGRHFFDSLMQMHNRGNGKGGGIAAVGLDPVQMKVPKEILEDHYLVQVAYLDPAFRGELESGFIDLRYDVHTRYQVEESEDPMVLSALPVRPPQIWRYFCRAKPEALARFIEEKGLQGMDARRAEDEYVNQTSFAINHRFYVEKGMKAFVMSHGRDMVIMKVVGYAEDVIRFYRLEDFTAHVWIGHQRYPTKGKVWHPGGAHPFMGLDEGLVHNGDFANYHSVSEYLAQKNVTPLFLTDTEVSVLLFDLLNRTYGYPLEYIIEALAPTTERDFHNLPEDKKPIYQAIQRTHIHASPDGPWFFIIARNCFYDENKYQLIGITDTAMLRPQVFALVDGEVQIGLIGSEKQAIDSALRSIAADHPSVPRQADVYWNARGGSHTDGGAFVFTLEKEGERRRLSCANKFGTPVKLELDYDRQGDLSLATPLSGGGTDPLIEGKGEEVFHRFLAALPSMDAAAFRNLMQAAVARASKGGLDLQEMLDLMTLIIDRRYASGKLRRSRITEKALEAVNLMLRAIPRAPVINGGFTLVDLANTGDVPEAGVNGHTLVVDCRGFQMEGEDGPSFVIRDAYEKGWRRTIAIDAHGQRFFGCGLGQSSQGMKVETYGTPGDYLASGLSGAEVVVHGNAQDQLGQIFASGKLVVHGDVGQTFMYGAKGGEAYVMGNAAGRPLINAVGKPRVVINGTCLDYLAESFMAGDPLNGGGFVILNGMTFDQRGEPVELPTPYPGGNLFSLASGGAIYVRDPQRKVTADQLNGGCFGRMDDEDWKVILPYLQENERLFGVSVEGFLLKVDGAELPPTKVYRKIQPIAAKGAVEESVDDDI